MRIRLASLVSVAALILQDSSHAAGPRVAPVPESQRSSEQQSLAARFALVRHAQRRCHVHATIRRLAEHILPFEQYASSKSGLPPRHRALLSLRTGVAYPVRAISGRIAVAAARQAGLTSEELNRIAQGPDASGWDAFEASLLRAADELHVDSFVSDATWQALSARYNTNQLVDVIDTVGAFTMHAGAINSLGVEIEADCPRSPSNGSPVHGGRQADQCAAARQGPAHSPARSEGMDAGAAQAVRSQGDRPARRQRLRHVRPQSAGRPGSRRHHQHILNATTLSVRQRELLLMRIGVLCRSEYEWAAHSRLGRRAGMTDADVARIIAGPDSPGGDPVETAMLRATDELYRGRRGVGRDVGRAGQDARHQAAARRADRRWRISGRRRWRSTAPACSSTPIWRTSAFRRHCAEESRDRHAAGATSGRRVTRTDYAFVQRCHGREEFVAARG